MSDDRAERMLRVASYVENHLFAPISVQNLADVACYSLFHFCRTFNRIAGISPYDYLIRRRLSRAAEIVVTDPTRSITDIAFETGFQSSDGFTRAFRRMYSRTPSEARRSGIDGRLLIVPLDAERIETTGACRPLGVVDIDADIILEAYANEAPAERAFQALPDDVESADSWFGAIYPDLSGASPRSDVARRSHVFVGTEENQSGISGPFLIHVPAGSYHRIEYTGPADRLPIAEELVFSTFWPRLRGSGLPDRIFGRRTAGSISLFIPVPGI